MVRRFHTQHGPAVFQWCEAEADIEAPRRICRVATKRCRIDALKELIHKKRANSFATIGGQHSDAQFRRSLVYESVPRVGCRKEPQPGCAYWNTVNHRDQTRIAASRSPTFDISSNCWIAQNRPGQGREQGTAFPARTAHLMLQPAATRNSPLDFLEKRGLAATAPFTPGYHSAASSVFEPSTTRSASNQGLSGSAPRPSRRRFARSAHLHGKTAVPKLPNGPGNR
jgi:hypothetical protein